jgi:YfiH family protein
VSTVDEIEVSTDPPLWELAHWRKRYGLVAGITGRGTSPVEPFDLGLGSQSPVAATMARWHRFRSALPQFGGMTLSRQVHRNVVAWHDHATPDWTVSEGYDGHATMAAGLLLLVSVADCVPIYLALPGRGAVALLHAGWRGTAAGILRGGVERLCQATGAPPADVVMHCGVAISGARYQVGREVMDGVGAPAVGTGPWHLDLRTRLAEQARRLGIGEVTVSGHCTAGAQDRFFSHRGSGGTDGRMVAYLGVPPG